jgi:hypothetical protein
LPMVAPIQSGMLGLYSNKNDLHNLKCYEYGRNDELMQHDHLRYEKR